MKKFLVAILGFIYLGTSGGIAVNVHYCMGKISSVDLMQPKDKCGKCGMKKGNGGCCKDEFKIVKLGDAHKQIFNEVTFSCPVGVLKNDYPNIHEHVGFFSINTLFHNNSPPVFSPVSRNILYGVFII